MENNNSSVDAAVERCTEVIDDELKVEVNVDAAVEPKVEVSVDAAVEPKVEVSVDEPKVDAVSEPKVDAVSEPKVDAVVEVEADKHEVVIAVDEKDEINHCRLRSEARMIEIKARRELIIRQREALILERRATMMKLKLQQNTAPKVTSKVTTVKPAIARASITNKRQPQIRPVGVGAIRPASTGAAIARDYTPLPCNLFSKPAPRNPNARVGPLRQPSRKPVPKPKPALNLPALNPPEPESTLNISEIIQEAKDICANDAPKSVIAKPRVVKLARTVNKSQAAAAAIRAYKKAHA